MKLALNLLIALATVGAQSQLNTVQDRVERNMVIWAATMAHCRENSGDVIKVDNKKFKACKKCFGGVGDWLNEEGLKRGMTCLQEFEPETIATCGEMMKELPAKDFNLIDANKVLVCWENVHHNSIGEKCLKSTGGKDMVLANMCMLNHLRQDHHFAEHIILGEKLEEQGDPLKPSKLQMVMESLFVEGRCIHANEGNNDRIAECVMCFNRANPMLMGADHKEKDMHMHMKKDHMDKEHHFRKIFTKYAACANVYLAPAYSECFEQMDELLELDIEEWRSKEGKGKIDLLQACLLIKQSNYWWKDCIDNAGEGIEGLKAFRECARNTTINWVASRRPQALDMLDLFMKGHGATVEGGGLITELV